MIVRDATLNEMGFSSDWIERQLAHTEPNAVRQTYNHADYFKDREKMMQVWVMLPPYSSPRPSRNKPPGPSMAPSVLVRPAAS